MYCKKVEPKIKEGKESRERIVWAIHQMREIGTKILDTVGALQEKLQRLKKRADQLGNDNPEEDDPHIFWVIRQRVSHT